MGFRLVDFLRCDKGASTVEYGMIAGGLAAVVLGTIRYMGTTLSGKMNTISNTLS